MRALRVDKMTYAALEATLQEYAAGRAGETVPVARMIAATAEDIAARAGALAAALRGSDLSLSLVDGVSTIGGGSAPGSELKTVLIRVVHPRLGAAQVEERLRTSDPPVIARIEHDRVVLDMRTVLPDQETVLVGILRALVS